MIVWQESLDMARQRAREEGKQILVYWFDPRCSECQQLEAATWTDECVAKILNSQFIPLKINVVKQRPLFEEYRIRRTPTIAFLDIDRIEHRLFTGFLAPRELCAWILLDAAETAISLRRYDLTKGQVDTALATAKGFLPSRRQPIILRPKLAIQKIAEISAQPEGQTQGISRL